MVNAMSDLMEAVLLIVLGGIFGWLLGKLPDRWVYAVMAGAVVLALLVIGGRPV